MSCDPTSGGADAVPEPSYPEVTSLHHPTRPACPGPAQLEVRGLETVGLPVRVPTTMSHSVTVIRTTTSSSNVLQSSSGLFDRGYSRSWTGILKLGQMLTLLLAFICVWSNGWTNYTAYCYFEVVTISFMILIFIFYLVNVFRIYRALTCISWPLAELLHYAIGTFLLLIASIVAAVKSSKLDGLIAGTVFGFIATFLCILGMWLSYKVSFVAQSSGASV
ncbi:CKLF-like MARVEL transmembrane domain-containing protein 7 isoform X2 [Spea bombifrons]|uniref:CKLF-like MARVEL transmembrane domain-containing protein 7 isoform X2 n=1 Tax=Spea bombifrons TaxID=233779 RepID=UPI0023499913|nr:CKLF-like MARVEL transmembrane domain-containing protein 7 isoform X2 [Spea bombifrons]